MADNFSLFGPDPQQVEQLLRQQQQAEAMQYATQMGPQGNPFYIPSIAAGFHQGLVSKRAALLLSFAS